MPSENQGQKKRGGVGKKGESKGKKWKRTKYRYLDPSINLKTRYEEIADVASYIDDLSEEDKKWMNQFMKEYVAASVDKDPEKALHNTPELRKSCFDKNNARNRDVYSRETAQGTLNYLEDYYQIMRVKEKAEESAEEEDGISNNKI